MWAHGAWLAVVFGGCSAGNTEDTVLRVPIGTEPYPTLTTATAGSFPDSEGLVGTQFSINAGSDAQSTAVTSFSQPLGLLLNYQNFSEPAADLSIWTVSSGTWIAVPGSTIDTSTQTVSVTVDTTGIFSLWDAERDAP